MADVKRETGTSGREGRSSERPADWLRPRLLAGAAALMDATSRAVRWLPPPARYLPADAITLPLARVWASRMPVIERNFATMLGAPVSHPRVRALARASVQNYGRMSIDFLAVRTMRDAEVLAWVSRDGEEHLQEALRQGRGVILALPHLGSWDVAAVFAQANGWNLTVVTESDWMAELVAGSRMGAGLTLVPRDRSPRALFRALRRNECVALLSDIADDGLQAAEVPFFGRPAPFPLGPARLAQRTGAPIMVIGSTRQPDHSYHVEAQPLLRPDPDRPDDEAAVALTAAMAAGFERIVTAYPAQWYPFHPIWPA